MATEEGEVDLEIALQEKGGSAGISAYGGASDETGERLLASRSRVVGPRAARAALHRMRVAAAAAGHPGGPLYANVYPDPDGAGRGELPGRAVSMMEGQARASVSFPHARLGAMSGGDFGSPEDAFELEDFGARSSLPGTRVWMGYLSSGQNISGADELAGALSAEGVSVGRPR